MKRWEFQNDWGKTEVIELSDECIWRIEQNRRFKYDFDRIWKHKIHGAPAWVVQELYIEMAKKNLGGEQRHKRFWRFIDLDALNEFEESIDIDARRDTLQLSRNGVRLTTVLDVQNKYAAPSKKEETLDRIFFLGFEQWGTPLSLRKKIRLEILNALSPESEFTLRDAFPLIDYDKIQTESVTSRDEDLGGSNYGGKFQFLHKESVEVGGWDRGGGGSKTVSLERFLANEWEVQSEAPALFLARIQEAIIKE